MQLVHPARPENIYVKALVAIAVVAAVQLGLVFLLAANLGEQPRRVMVPDAVLGGEAACQANGGVWAELAGRCACFTRD